MHFKNVNAKIYFGDANMFSKELKNSLLEQYKFRIELHAHTSPASGCSQISPEMMAKTYKKLGYDAVTVTNHFIYQPNSSKEEYIKAYIRDFEETKEYGDELGIKVYLGAEIRFTENNNDYLIFGVDEEMLFEIYDLLPLGIENFRKNFSMPNSVFIQAHPMRDGIQTVDSNLIDGIEVFNMHPSHNSRVGLASVYAAENNVSVIIAGSDFHHPNRNHEGVASMRSVYLPKDSFELAKLIKGGDYLLEIGRNNLIIP